MEGMKWKKNVIILKISKEPKEKSAKYRTNLEAPMSRSCALYSGLLTTWISHYSSYISFSTHRFSLGSRPAPLYNGSSPW